MEWRLVHLEERVGVVDSEVGLAVALAEDWVEAWEETVVLALEVTGLPAA